MKRTLKTNISQTDDDHHVHQAMGSEQDDHYIHQTKEFEQADIKRRNGFPVPLFDAACLMLSSCSFLIPANYAYQNDLVMYCITSIVTTVISIMYWYHAIPGWRRNADLIVSKASFGIYFITGLFFIRTINTTIGWPLCAAIIGFYMAANKLWERDSAYWMFFHMMFHFSVAIEQLVVIMAITKSANDIKY
jgi:hypothetical protein